MAKGASLGMDEFIAYERKRGDCYRLLAACFYPPEKIILIEEGLFRALEGLLRDISPSAAVHAAAMGDALKQISEEDLAVEYARLFVGPYELKAPPYGSVYVENAGRVMGDSTMAVMRFYEEEGLSMDGDFRELPDHIAAQLEFMYYLIFRRVEFLEKSDEDAAMQYLHKQVDFLHGFLGRWVDPFSERMKAGSQSPFYQALAKCVSAFVMNAVAEVLPVELPDLRKNGKKKGF